MEARMDSAEGLRRIIKRCGMSQGRFAQHLGYKQKNSIFRYISGEYADRPLPADLVRKLIKNVANTGCPPVTEEEILKLGGIASLIKTEGGRSIIGYNAAITTGCYIPVLSIGDAMNIEEKEGEALVLSPIKHALSDRHLDGNEFSIFIPDDSMGVKFPAGSLAIVQPMKEGSPPLVPGQSAFLRITHADGREEGVVRLYSLKGYSDDTGEKIEDYKALGDGFPSFKVGAGAAFPRVKLVGRVVQIKVTYDL